MSRKYFTWIFVAAVVLIPMGVFAVVKWCEQRYTELPVLGPASHRVADFDLTNQNGSRVTLQNWKDKIVVANLFFTHCPAVCPKMIRNLKKVRQVYMDRNDLLLSSFSVDPERDSTGQLKRYAAKVGLEKDWDLITGDKKEIYKLARKSLLAVATDGDGGPNDFIHSEQLVLIDRDHRIRGFYRGTEEGEVNHLITDIQRLQKEYAKKN